MIPGEVQERKRYAKVNSFTSEIRLPEDCVYSKVSLSFTEDTRQEKQYELIQDIDLVMSKTKNY